MAIQLDICSRDNPKKEESDGKDLAKAMSDGNTPIAHVNRWAWTHYSFPARMRKLWQTHRFFKKTAAILHPGDGQQVLEAIPPKIYHQK